MVSSRALVGGEAAPEPDGQHVRINGIRVLQQPIEVRFATLVA